MKEFFKVVLKGLVSFVVLVFFILLSWSMVVAMLKYFDESFANADKTVVLAMVSAIVSVITIILSKSLDRKSMLLSEKKKVNQPIYEKLVADVLSREKDGEQLKTEYAPFLLSHSSDDVYNEFNEYCSSDLNNNEKLLLALRKELKLTNKK